MILSVTEYVLAILTLSPQIGSRIKLASAQSYLRISTDKAHPLQNELKTMKGNRFKKGKS